MKSFTILELIVALSVIVIIMGLGFTGLINFKSTSELQNAYSGFVTDLKTLQNKAKNSINGSTTNDQAPDGYAIFFGTGSYLFSNCFYSSTDNKFASCNNASATQLNPSIVLTADAGCAAVSFLRLTGDAVKINDSNPNNYTYTSTGTCTVTFTHLQISSTKIVTINLTNNSIDL